MMPARNGVEEYEAYNAKGKEQGPVKCYKFSGGSDNDLSNGWYAVIGNVTYSKSIYVRGNANLILCDGSRLTAKDGICVEKDAKLTIWAQSTDGKTRGKLVARDPDRKAGIGRIGNAAAGAITINGGDINTKGGREYAGITADIVTINNGKVYACGENGGAGIGGGRGDGEKNNNGGQGSHVSITGTADVIALTITTKRYSHCSAIGHGHNNKEYGTITFGDNMMVQADWSNKAGEAGEPFPWDNRQGGCFYRWYAHIRPCDHRNATYSNITEKTHTVNACEYCKQGGRQEAHTFKEIPRN